MVSVDDPIASIQRVLLYLGVQGEPLSLVKHYRLGENPTQKVNSQESQKTITPSYRDVEKKK